jgi:hypothetical protein
MVQLWIACFPAAVSLPAMRAGCPLASSEIVGGEIAWIWAWRLI